MAEKEWSGRFDRPSECPTPAKGTSSDHVSRVSIALLQEQVTELQAAREHDAELYHQAVNWAVDLEARAATSDALARAEGNLTTACILIGNLLSSDDDADVAAGREFIDAVVASWESTPTSAGVAGGAEG